MSDPDYFWTCARCGGRSSMPESLNEWYREDARRTFYCPKGHNNVYSNKNNDIDQMRRERNRLKQKNAYYQDCAREESERADTAERSAAAYKGVATRMKNRAKAGVCPCCNRSFKNLARHMKSQHPDADNIVEIGQAG